MDMVLAMVFANWSPQGSPWPGVLEGADPLLLSLGSAVGVLAAVVQFLGLIRWPFLVPYIARAASEPAASEARKEAVDVVFQSFNRFLGVAVGKHLGCVFTGAWSVLVGAAIVQSDVVPAWLGLVGIVVGAVLAFCSLEFVGPFERDGWKVAAALTPTTYIAWPLWLVATGVAMLL